MNIDDVIKRFKSYHPITEEDKEAFECAIQCMQFTKDFLPLNATPDRMEHAINLLNSLEYAIDNVNRKQGFVYFTYDENKLKEFNAGPDRIAQAKANTERYLKRE